MIENDRVDPETVTPLLVLSIGGGAMKCGVQWVNTFRGPWEHPSTSPPWEGMFYTVFCYTGSVATSWWNASEMSPGVLWGSLMAYT